MTNSQLPSHARVVKAHGAGNSFVVATDRFDEDNPSEAQVAALCSPAFGIGADGFIRAVERDGVWFMDYRNADGSKAEMCGNGVRVFVDHLRREGLVDLPVGQTLDVATRGGIKRVTPEADDEGAGARYRVDMGPAASPARETIQVSIPGIDGVLGGIWVDMPNPHTVVELADESALRGVSAHRRRLPHSAGCAPLLRPCAALGHEPRAGRGPDPARGGRGAHRHACPRARRW